MNITGQQRHFIKRLKPVQPARKLENSVSGSQMAGVTLSDI